MRSTRPEKGHILHLTQIVWMRPLVISKQPIEVHIDLELQENQKVIFTIRRQTHETEDEALTIVSQGRAELHIGEEMAPSLDLTAIQTRCQHSSLSATECYQRYRELGISYGPTLQGIVYLNLGEGELLARLSLPAAVAQAHTEGASYVLHPSVLDAALQAACIGLLMEPNTLQAPYLPFELEELSILRKVPTQGWAWVRWMSGSTTGLVGKGLAPYSTSTCVTMKDVSRCIYVV